MTEDAATPVGESQRRYVTRDGVTLTYRLWRPDRHRRLLVLIHGIASNLSRWSEFVEYTRLRADWDILRLDLRGHGPSCYRGPLNMDIWCRDITDILDHERYQAAVFVGHSLGAQVALHLATTYPSRTAAIALIDPVFNEALNKKMRRLYRLRIVIKVLARLILVLNRLGLKRRRIPQRDLRKLDEQTRANLLDAGRIEEMVASYGSPWPDLKHFPTADYLQELAEIAAPVPHMLDIDVPVLVVLASAPTYTDPAIAEKIVGRFHSAELIRVDAYHWPLTERPQETRAAIEAWCARLPAPEARNTPGD